MKEAEAIGHVLIGTVCFSLALFIPYGALIGTVLFLGWVFYSYGK